MILISITVFAEAEDGVYPSQSNKLIFAQLRRGSTYTPPPPRPPQYQGGNQAAPGKNQPYQRPTLPPRQLVPRSAQAPPPGSRRYNLPPEIRRNPIKAAPPPRNIPVKLSSWDRPLPSANLLSSPTTTYSARAKLLSSVPAANLLPAKTRIQKVELDQKIKQRLTETRNRVREVLERAKKERRYSSGGKSDPRHPANARLLAKNLASVSQMGEDGIIMAGPGSKKPFDDAPRVAAVYGGHIEDWVKKSSTSYVNPQDGTKFQTHWIENLKSGERLEFKTIVNEKVKP